MHRACDHKLCIKCGLVISSSQEGCAVTVPSKRLKRLSQKTLDKFQLKWNKDNIVDYLHYDCWMAISKDKKNFLVNSSELLILNDIEDTVERFCTESELAENANTVAQLMLKSKRTVCFTGAGISASAGLPTYRGSDGIDTIAALSSQVEPSRKRSASDIEQGKVVDLTKEECEVSTSVDDFDDDYSKLRPTLTHKCLASLHSMDKLDYCITQNCDNLHVKGGLPRDAVSDLHGNVFVEYCEDCLTEYERDYAVDAFSTDCYNEPYYVACKMCKYNHYTGRKCESGTGCKGKLRDTIVNFHDDLHDTLCGGLLKATKMARQADLCLALGTSLTVSPANYLPTKAKKLVIVNLQETELDAKCHVRVWAKTDDFFRVLMPLLNTENDSTEDKPAEKRAKVV